MKKVISIVIVTSVVVDCIIFGAITLWDANPTPTPEIPTELSITTNYDWCLSSPSPFPNPGECPTNFDIASKTKFLIIDGNGDKVIVYGPLMIKDSNAIDDTVFDEPTCVEDLIGNTTCYPYNGVIEFPGKNTKEK